MINKEVICIQDSYPVDPEVAKLFPNWIKKDSIYTVRKIQQNFNGDWGVLLEGVKNPKFKVNLQGNMIGVAEPGFNLNRFRYLDGTELKATLVNENININQN